jgi:hypothetical protein
MLAGGILVKYNMDSRNTSSIQSSGFTDECLFLLPKDETVSELSHDLEGLFENEEKLEREFCSNMECLDFFKRIQDGKAEAKAFKEFPYRKGGQPFTVEREIWFRDYGGILEERKYVIVHVHYSDSWNKYVQRQQVTQVTQINLRHFTEHQVHQVGAGAHEAMFKSTYLEEKGKPVFRNSKCVFQGAGWEDKNIAGWAWNNFDAHGHNFGNLPQWYDNMPRLDRERVIAGQDEKPAEIAHVLSCFLNKVNESMVGAKLLNHADQEDLKYLGHSRIGLEVLAIGNDSYCIEGMRDHGKLRNCVSDARSVSDSFKKLDAKCKLIMDVKDRQNLRRVVLDWAESKLMHQHVKTAFFFWAGHALYYRGSTHLLPTLQDERKWRIDKIEPGENTVKVCKIISLVKKYSKCDLIVCLDSCRTRACLG